VSEPQPPSAFFDNFPRFYATGNTGAGVRLNARHECLIERHGEHLRDRTILDVGSHNGRWSFAALAAGARRVTGVEPRAALVEASKQVFLEYGIAPERFDFHVADILEFLKAKRPRADTVLLFGVLYHVPYHVALLQELRQTSARTLLIDTAVVPDRDGDHGQDNTICLIAESVADISNAAGEIFPGAGKAIVGIPSRRAVTFLLETFEFEVSEVSWAPYLRRWGVGGLRDYAQGQRATFLARRRETSAPERLA